jgi:hypothetical protein
MLRFRSLRSIRFALSSPALSIGQITTYFLRLVNLRRWRRLRARAKTANSANSYRPGPTPASFDVVTLGGIGRSALSLARTPFARRSQRTSARGARCAQGTRRRVSNPQAISNRPPINRLRATVRELLAFIEPPSSLLQSRTLAVGWASSKLSGGTPFFSNVGSLLREQVVPTVSDVFVRRRVSKMREGSFGRILEIVAAGSAR